MGKTGVLVIAQNSSDSEISNAIEKIYQQANIPIPRMLGFLDCPDNNVDNAIEYLKLEEVEHIICVPLMETSVTDRILEILAPYKDIDLIVTAGLDSHPLVAEILMENLTSKCPKPKGKIAFLVGSAPEPDLADKVETDLMMLVGRVMVMSKFTNVRYVLIDALRSVISSFQDKYDIFITPVLLGNSGDFESILYQELKGLQYHFTEKYLLPHGNLSRLIEWRVAEKLLLPITFKKDSQIISMGLDDFQSVAMKSNATYPCTVLGFRTARIAFRELSDNKPLQPEHLKLKCHLPPEVGTRPIYEYILSKDNVRYTGDWFNVEPNSSTFIFTNNSTGKEVCISTKPEAFGGREFFNIRNRWINEKGQEGDRKMVNDTFKLMLSNLLTWSDEELFDIHA